MQCSWKLHLLFQNIGGREMTKRLKYQISLLVSLLFIFVICNFAVRGKLLTGTNIQTILSHAVFPVLTSYGLMFIFSGGLIDLSVGANILLSANIGALLGEQLGLGYPGLILGAVFCAVIAEQLAVQCTLSLHIPAWISGLGSALVLEAILAQWSTVVAAKANKLPTVKNLRALGQMPGMLILLFVAAVAAYIIFNRTTLGINLQAMGGNAHVSEVMGINIRKTLIGATVVGGIFVGLASVNNISFAGKLDCYTGLNSLNVIFKSLAATLLADSIQNIFTKPVGILISGVSVVALFNILTLLGVPSGNYQNIALGVVVIVCGILSHLNYKGVMK